MTLFAAIHLEPVMFPTHFLFAVACAVLLYQTRSALAPMVAHAVVNAIALCT